MPTIAGQVSKVRRARPFKCYYPTAYQPWDSVDFNKGLPHAYTVLNTGAYAGTTRIPVSAYNGATISFSNGDPLYTVFDSANGLSNIRTGDIVRIHGSALNDGDYTVTFGSTHGSFEVDGPLVDEAAGRMVTISKCEDHTNAAVMEGHSGLMWSQQYCGGKVGLLSDGNLYHYLATTLITFYTGTLQVLGAENIVRIIGGAAEAYRFFAGMSFSFTGLTLNPATFYARRIDFTGVNGADLDLGVWTGNHPLVDEGPVAGAIIKINHNSIWTYINMFNALAVGGHTDWRVPSANELNTLIERDVASGLPDPVAFPGWLTSITCWSADLSPSGTSYAMGYSTYHGQIPRLSRSTAYRVVPVRTLP